MTKKLNLLFLGLFFVLSSSIFGQTSTTNIVVTNGIRIVTIISIAPVGTNTITNNTSVIVTNGLPSLSSLTALISTNNISVSTNLLQVLGVSTNGQKIALDFLNNFVDTIPYWKNDIVDVDLLAFYNPSQKQLGYFGGIDIPVGAQASMGAGLVRFDKQWDLIPVDVKLGMTIHYPYIGGVYNYFATGPEMNLNTGQLGTYNFIGAVKTWDISSRWKLSFGIGGGDVSTIKGLNFDTTLRLNYHW